MKEKGSHFNNKTILSKKECEQHPFESFDSIACSVYSFRLVQSKRVKKRKREVKENYGKTKKETTLIEF